MVVWLKAAAALNESRRRRLFGIPKVRAGGEAPTSGRRASSGAWRA